MGRPPLHQYISRWVCLPTPAPGNNQAAPNFQFYGSNNGGAHVAIKTTNFPFPSPSWCNLCVKLNLGSAQIGNTNLNPGT